MIADNEMRRSLITAKLLQTSYIVSAFIYIVILYIVKNYIELRIFPLGNPTLNRIELLLIIISVIVLAFGYFLLRRTTKWHKKNLRALFRFSLIRSTFFGCRYSWVWVGGHSSITNGCHSVTDFNLPHQEQIAKYDRVNKHQFQG
jgi:H+/Cl- antiporter ClcA